MKTFLVRVQFMGEVTVKHVLANDIATARRMAQQRYGYGYVLAVTPEGR